MLAYAERMPAVRAAWKLEMAEAATVPHLPADAVRSWRAAMLEVLARVNAVVELPFTLNGRSIATRALRRQFAKLLGSGYADA